MVDFHILIENHVGTQHRNSHLLFSTPETLRGKTNKKQPPCRIDAGLEGIFLGEGLTFGSLSTGRGWGCKGFNLARQLLSSWQSFNGKKSEKDVIYQWWNPKKCVVFKFQDQRIKRRCCFGVKKKGGLKVGFDEFLEFQKHHKWKLKSLQTTNPS